jgi:MerR family transcriptional regulator, thiopeptide resistance regulator
VGTTYRVQQFADLAGVTVRALHHYDRLALLKPHRTDTGYRMYSAPDLDRLERIVALKFLGIPLKQIKAVLDRDTRSLPAVLRSQRQALEEKRRRLEIAIEASREAEQTVAATGPPDASIIRRIIEVIEMQENTEYFKQFYNDEAWAALEKRRAEMTPEMRQRAEDGTRRWMELFHDVDAAMAANVDPGAERAQELGGRWKALVEEFTQGDRGISQGLQKVWANKEQWPAQMQKQASPFMDQKVWDYMGRVFAASSPK